MGIGISIGVGIGGSGGGSGGSGGVPISLKPTKIPYDATGDVAQLKTSLKGTLVWSKLSGASSIAIAASTGVVSLSAALGEGGTATFAVRVQNSDGDAAERSFTLTAVSEKPVFYTDPSISPEEGNSATTFTATDGTSDGVVVGTWLLDGEEIGTELTVVTGVAGTLVRRNVATGPGGTTTKDSAAVIVTSAAVNPPVVVDPPSYTGTLGETLTHVHAVFEGATSQVDGWLVDGIFLEGDTLDSSQYPGSTVIPRSIGTNEGGSTGSNGESITIPGSPGLYFQDNFNAADGVKLTTRGWSSLLGSGTWTDGMITTASQAFNSNFSHGLSNDGLVVDTSSQNQAVEGAIAGLGANATPQFNPIIRASDWDNNIYLSSVGSDGSTYCAMVVRLKVAGTVLGYNAGLVYTPVLQAGDIIRLEVQQNLVKMFLNNVQYTIGGPLGTPVPRPGTGVIDLVAAGASSLTGTKAGFTLVARGTCDDVKVYNLTFPFGISTINDGVEADYLTLPNTSGRQLVVAGTYSGTAPTGIDIGVAKADGSTVISRVAADSFTATGGNWTAKLRSNALMGATLDNINVYVQAWKKDAATNTGKSSLFKTSTYAVMHPYVQGVNSNNLAYFKPAGLVSDLMYRAMWLNKPNGKVLVMPVAIGSTATAPATADENCNIGTDGILHTFSDGTTVCNTSATTAPIPTFQMPQFIDPSLGTTYRISGVPEGLQIRNLITAAGTLGSRQGPDADGYYYYDFTYSVDAHGRTLNALPTFCMYGTVPEEGFNKALAFRPLDWDGHFLTPAGRAMYGGPAKKVARFMQTSQVSGDTLAPYARTAAWIPPVNQNRLDRALMSPAAMVEWCNDAGCDLWFNFSHAVDDDYVTAVATYVKENLNPGLMFRHALSNETWNSNAPYETELVWCAIAGLQLGYEDINKATPAACTPRTPTIINGYGNGTVNASGVTTVARAVGDLVFMKATGNIYQLWQITTAVSAGGTISAANATKLSEGTANTASLTVSGPNLASRRWKVSRQKQIAALVDAVYGADARTKTWRIHEDWVIISGTVVGNTLLWDDAYKVLDDVATAPYWGDGVFKFIGVQTHIAQGWTKDVQQLYLVDQDTYYKVLFTGSTDGTGSLDTSPIYAAMKPMVQYQVNAKHNLERILRTKEDYVPNSIRFSSYECGFGETWNSPSGADGIKGVVNGNYAYSITQEPDGATKGVISHLQGFYVAGVVGVYTITFTSATDFAVTNADGSDGGTGTVGTVFTNTMISFKINAGATAFVTGDIFKITRTNAFASTTAIDYGMPIPYVNRTISNTTKHPKFADITQRFYQHLKDYVGGAHMQFCDGENDGTYNNVINCFGMIDFPGDLTSTRYVGWDAVKSS